MDSSIGLGSLQGSFLGGSAPIVPPIGGLKNVACDGAGGLGTPEGALEGYPALQG